MPHRPGKCNLGHSRSEEYAQSNEEPRGGVAAADADAKQLVIAHRYHRGPVLHWRVGMTLGSSLPPNSSSSLPRYRCWSAWASSTQIDAGRIEFACDPNIYFRIPQSRRALQIAETESELIAATAMMRPRSNLKAGTRAPAAKACRGRCRQSRASGVSGYCASSRR